MADYSIVMGGPGCGKSLALIKSQHKNLQKIVKYAGQQVAINANEITRILYDKAIDNLVSFEKEHKIHHSLTETTFYGEHK